MKSETHITSVTEHRWAPDDTYQMVEVQVDFPARTHVRVTVTPITQDEYEAWLRGDMHPNGDAVKP